MQETDLFPPVKKYLEANGYTVRAEVQDCDITATKDDELLIIELKLNVNIPLLIQATDRQRITDAVYVAIPRPSNHTQKKRWKGVKHILRRLELGLIFVDVELETVEIVFHPLEFQKKKIKKRRKSLLQEVSQRDENLNIGGSSRRKIMTAYRRNAMQIAALLAELGPSKPKDLRKLGTGEKTLSILSSNFYGWFQRVERGVYDLTAKGKEVVEKYGEILRQK
ncbi:MAG: DUF2161 family putative PD-(D/E)XK-type phosphodiesterase [Candidatus Cloacimonadales bacterium]|nr:DUF2161 family putative PD-(D/E)XK-type phosphodiesterase [Candidatus Cloacimonadales bacterium]